MRFLICAVWALGYCYVSELFPSVVRSLALCLISAGGSIGSIA
jgi:OCT family organic cation transporter-like MFS transporter 4/5